jgi:hypothetical protein
MSHDDIRGRLIGRTISKVEISDDRYEIKFVTDRDPVELEVHGDCCSRSWIESIDDPDVLLGTVTDVEEIKMPDLGNISTPYNSDPEYVAYYGLKISTEKGRAVIDYRNDSNGYYGGWISLKGSW